MGDQTNAPLQGGQTAGADPGHGGELHQTSGAGADERLTTNQGLPIADNQNSLRAGGRGPTLLEDFILREKITHFDHERIPERVVHARGSAAHGYFQVYKPLSQLTKAAFLNDPEAKTRVFVRFSTVAGERGSFDLARDVRGFAVKFYTEEGNFDLVGNNIPVFFIQDAIKFPDLIHSVKPEADRGMPQAASAHDTFWDFASLTPESLHMLMWVMSDRAIPRSYRMMEGFGIHTFRLVNAEGASTFVKFHWRPTIGSQSVIWDEAVKINGADPDFHRRDLWQAIESGAYPEYELGLQVFDEAQAASFDFDVLDATKLVPEEVVPVEIVGKLVLDRNPDNFFAETEQVAFCPSHLVPGIEFSDDPLLQGRLFSYLDTQLSRLGGPNFHEIPINRPVCPMHNFQRDGHMRMGVSPARAAYEPNSLEPNGPRENPQAGFSTYPSKLEGPKLRIRAESFADHYSQARLFYLSMTEPERHHIESAFAFELGKVETPAIRQRMLGHLALVDRGLAETVAGELGMPGAIPAFTPAMPVNDSIPPSPALSLIGKAPATLKGRKIGVLVSDGFDPAMLDGIKAAAKAEDATVEVIAPKVGGVKPGKGAARPADHALAGAPSVLFDAVALVASAAGAKTLARQAAAIDWIRDAFSHLKVIAFSEDASLLFREAGLADKADDGVLTLRSPGDIDAFIAKAKTQRIWGREAVVRP
ncbi:MAG: catalase [Rhodospirillales bacterium]